MKSFFIITGAVLFFSMGNCTVDVADGGTEAGNAKITGIIVEKDGHPVENALVTLLKKTDSLHNEIDTALGFDTSVYTNSKGEYKFDLPDSGLYCIVAKKFERYISYIDNIHVNNSKSIPISTDTVNAPGTIAGVIFLEDTAGIKNKKLSLTCKELKDLKLNPFHGKEFTISDLPEGKYDFICKANSEGFLLYRIKIKVISDSSYDIGDITIKELPNYLKSSNVMTDELVGLTNVSVDIIPKYTFHVKPYYADGTITTLPDNDTILVKTIIDEYNISLNLLKPFLAGKVIQLSLKMTFVNGKTLMFDFSQKEKMAFETQ